MTERKFESADNKHHYDVTNENEGYNLYIPYSEHKDIVEIVEFSIRSYGELIDACNDAISNIESTGISDDAKEYMTKEKEHQIKEYQKKLEIADKMLFEMVNI